MKKEYEDLYNAIVNDKRYTEQFTKKISKPVLTCLTAVKGSKYGSIPVRFMLVGRAVNGWDEKITSEDTITLEEFVKHSLNNLDNKEGTVVTENGQDRFEWIDCSGKIPHNQFREGIDSNRK